MQVPEALQEMMDIYSAVSKCISESGAENMNADVSFRNSYRNSTVVGLHDTYFSVWMRIKSGIILQI
jgi:hypothetical protein